MVGNLREKIANSSGWCGKEFNWNELDKVLRLADDRAIFFLHKSTAIFPIKNEFEFQVTSEKELQNIKPTKLKQLRNPFSFPYTPISLVFFHIFLYLFLELLELQNVIPFVAQGYNFKYHIMVRWQLLKMWEFVLIKECWVALAIYTLKAYISALPSLFVFSKQ